MSHKQSIAYFPYEALYCRNRKCYAGVAPPTSRRLFADSAYVDLDLSGQGTMAVGKVLQEYYDIALVGKTGQGKSSLGNKLIDLESTRDSRITSFDGSTSGTGRKRFIQADDPGFTQSQQAHSVTEKCKLLANEDTNVRVLDVPGFSDSGTSARRGNVYESNLQTIRWVVRVQIQSELKVRRIVYFLPVRGPLEKADGTMQEELKVLHHFFGKEVFDCMVVVATLHRKHQLIGFDDDDYKATKEVFKIALDRLFHGENISCPPVVFIGLKDSSRECMRKIKGAFVRRETFLPLRFSDNICTLCSVKIRCSKEKEKIAIVLADGTSIPYVTSKCHPFFVQKYSGAAKFFGGLGHVLTLGMGLWINNWPGFTNHEEVCAACRQPPGAPGCEAVGKILTLERRKVIVDHSNAV